MTSDQPPAKAILSDEEWEAATDALILVVAGKKPGPQSQANWVAMLRADRATLRAKLAERDRLLARCAETMRHNLVDPPTINPLDLAYARVHDENRCVLCAVKAALEKP